MKRVSCLKDISIYDERKIEMSKNTIIYRSANADGESTFSITMIASCIADMINHIIVDCDLEHSCFVNVQGNSCNIRVTRPSKFIKQVFVYPYFHIPMEECKLLIPAVDCELKKRKLPNLKIVWTISDNTKQKYQHYVNINMLPKDV